MKNFSELFGLETNSSLQVGSRAKIVRVGDVDISTGLTKSLSRCLKFSLPNRLIDFSHNFT